MSKTKHYNFFLLFGILFLGEASAMMVHYRSSVELKSEAKIVVIATILSAQVIEATPFHKEYQYKISIDQFEKGTLEEKEPIVCYNKGLPHQRGELSVSPLNNGSGIESDLESGGSYRLYLHSELNLEILLAEKM